jgi:hypothetical protein
MAGGAAVHSVRAMINHRTRLTALAVAVTAAAALPASAQAARKTHTLRFYDRMDKLVLTHADGTVVDHAPYPQVQSGDTLEIYSREFAGNHAHHAKRASGSNHLVCKFSDAPEPDCVSHVAFGGSMLIFSGDPGTLIGGTGRYLHATGRVLSNQEVKGGNDIVAKIRY